MVTLLNDSMVNTRNGRANAEASQANGPNPPPSLTLAQAIASILKSRDEQTELLHQLVNNSPRGGNGARNAQGQAPTTYGEFWPLIHQPLLKTLSRCRLNIGCAPSSTSLGSSTARSIRRPTSSRNSYWEMLVHGGPTKPPLAPRTTKCCGPSFMMPSAPITS
jgi:hypothetical protein